MPGQRRQPGQRKLPQWYLDKVNLAAAVFANAPQPVDMRIPQVMAFDTGAGVSIRRQGNVGAAHKVATRQWLAAHSNQGKE